MNYFKNRNTYRGRFANLRLHAFGQDQILQGEYTVEIYQQRCRPIELWRCRQIGPPASKSTQHKWESSTAEGLMYIVERDFEKCISPWEKALPWPFRPVVRDNPAAKVPTQRKIGGAA